MTRVLFNLTRNFPNHTFQMHSLHLLLHQTQSSGKQLNLSFDDGFNPCVTEFREVWINAKKAHIIQLILYQNLLSAKAELKQITHSLNSPIHHIKCDVTTSDQVSIASPLKVDAW